ncbi:hypothetical protein EGW08_014926 [Elysia chlorotica]|uniref:Cysteine dioxygenase n=1 Tax=Elysia chlorotica TaxID=188477 RepID=A0A433T6V9_ELYCH|nr:hypothetical protein EGW08_014926 [Elysia chlorotica]
MECEIINERPVDGRCSSGEVCVQSAPMAANGGHFKSEGNRASRPPAMYSDPSTIVPPASLSELIQTLHDVFAHEDISIEYVQTLMASYKSNPREWKKFAKFDKHRYTRNLVDDGNGKFNLMLLCWNEAQGSSIHSHANSHCFLKVLDGTVKEEMFEWPENCDQAEAMDEDGDEADRKDGSNSGMQKRDESQIVKNACGYINDDIGLHRVENPSHVDKAVTLHLYSPPFDECECFDERTGKHTTAKVTFWSKFGKRTPFGRHRNVPISCTTEAENN